MDHSTGLSKGYGFVKFQQREQAEAAIKNLNGHKIGSKTLKVSTARKTSRKGGETGPTNLYIANLDKDIESSDLERYFSKVGYIVQCRVLKDEKGVTRRIGFVRYDNNDSALKAIKEFDGKKLDGKGSVIQVRFANTPRAPPGSQQYASPRIAPTSPLVDAVLLTPVARVGGGEEHVILSPVQAPALTEDGRLQTVYTFPTAAEENLTSPAMVPVSPTAGPYGSPRQSRVFGVGGNTTLLPPSELLQPREDSLPKYALKPIPRKGRPMLIPTESTPVGHEVAPTPPSVMVQSSPPPMVPEDAALPEAAAATGSSGRAAPTALPMQQVVYQVGGQQFQQVGTVGSPRTAQTVFITSPTSPGSTVISPATFAAQSPTTGQVMQVVRPLTLLNAQGGGRGEDQVQYVAVQSPHGVAGGVNAVTLTPVTIAAPDPTNTRNSQYSRSTACYVGGIEVDLQEADLKAAFEFDGIVVKSVRIIRRRVGPYAFVNFFNTRDAHKAAEKLNQSKLGNSQLTVRLK